MNWGHGIAIFFSCFVAFMIMLVVRAHQENIDLVTDNYYEQELKFQQQIDKINNAKQLESPVAVKFKNKTVSITFPPLPGIEGDIQIFRPSDSMFDLEKPVEVNADYQQVIPVDQLPAGFYRVKINWQSQGVEYYTEEALNFH
ncbi:FixH family protein [Litoribacter alkaliphilus]|uniref:FixH family protein n=1 Tax=Litoribacter ruber TaxID=702568 RepID=A0AAP2CF21_9BACT|nr:FixH family protein [Litoribacter alkaliphilus]MBS9523293.1 FixH family protein [Litoribacter alkaliphilus]